MSRFSKAILPFALSAPLYALHTQTTVAPDVTKQPTLYVVPYAHLDTQWRWVFCIGKCVMEVSKGKLEAFCNEFPIP